MGIAATTAAMATAEVKKRFILIVLSISIRSGMMSIGSERVDELLRELKYIVDQR